MKMNLFAVNDIADIDGKDGSPAYPGRTAKGNRAVDLVDYENEAVQSVDERRSSPIQILAQRFLTFLGNRRLSPEKLKTLPKIEQARLRKEFFDN